MIKTNKELYSLALESEHKKKKKFNTCNYSDVDQYFLKYV